MSGGNQRHPDEIRYHKAEKVLEILFDDQTRVRLPAELLRVESPSAEVQGHSPDQKTLVAGRSHVAIIGIEPVGNYAIKIIFDDLHDSGIFTWDYLHWMGTNQEELWQRYEQALAAVGLSRHPHKTA